MLSDSFTNPWTDLHEYLFVNAQIMNEGTERSSLESGLPVFFLASSAALLRGVLSSSSSPAAARQGIWLVILLWLSASLLRDLAFCLFAHVVFVCALASFALRSQQAERPHAPRGLVSLATASLLSLADSCLVGSWTALVFDTFYAASRLHSHFTFSAFVAVTLSHALYQYYKRRRRALQRGLQGMPLVTSTPNLSQSAFFAGPNSSSRRSRHDDEEQWYRWTMHQSLRWMATVLPPERAETVTRALGPERITCRQLFGLSATELRQMTLLPVGVILELLEHVQTLQEESPCPPDLVPRVRTTATDSHHPNTQAATESSLALERRNGERFHSEESSSWLDRYDAEYSNASDARVAAASSVSTVVIPDGYDMDDSAHDQRAQSVMKERFGLELPELRNKYEDDDDSGAAVPATPNAAPRPMQAPPSRTATAVGSSSSPVVASAAAAASTEASNSHALEDLLPSDFLANMPPHIASIAQRKPDLVRQILASKKPTGQRLLPVKDDQMDGKMPAVPEHDDDSDNDEEEEEYTTSGDEGERTELLRHRRKKPPPQAYNSIWNG